MGLLNTGNFGSIGNPAMFGDFNISFTAAAVGLHCKEGAAEQGGHFTATNVFTHEVLGTYTRGFWAEVDESSLLLLKLTCGKAAVTDSPPPTPPLPLPQPPMAPSLPNVNGAGGCASSLEQQRNEIERLRLEVTMLKEQLAGCRT